jgi:D-alanyl-D-alanine carboxypeptidase
LRLLLGSASAALAAGGLSPRRAGALHAEQPWLDEPLGDGRLFSLHPQVAREVWQKVTRYDALPPDYRPLDLVATWESGLPSANGGQYLRQVIVPDTVELVRAARAEGLDVSILSGFRSYGYQVSLFGAQVARRGGDEEAANRYSARPGHSQHQLGTTLDFSGFRAFAGSPAGAWVWEHAHEFGFVFPYTEASQDRTGYVSEPWHVRWVGRELATWMQGLGYQTSTERTADDLIAAVRTAAGWG